MTVPSIVSPEAFASTVPAAKVGARVAPKTLVLGSFGGHVRRGATLEMPARPLPTAPPPTSPTARSVCPTEPADVPFDIVVFPRGRISRLSHFARLYVASRQLTFLQVLADEGLTPAEYAASCADLRARTEREPALAAELQRHIAAAERVLG